ncbi:MAG: transposase [Nitrososphaerota archaeon]|nr:transposase [Nitrososphaerota archaeon]
MSLKPYGGVGIFPKGHPDRVPAQHVRSRGIRYEYMCLNVYHQRLSVSQQKHKGWRPWLKFISHERSRYPQAQRVYLIQDNLSAHWTQEVKAWARENNVSHVATATNASWMNHVECNAGDMEDMALSGTNYTDWRQMRWAFEKAISYRSRERVKRGKKFRDTQDGRRKHRKPLWKGTSGVIQNPLLPF